MKSEVGWSLLQDIALNELARRTRQLLRVSPLDEDIFYLYAGQLGRGLGPCPYTIKREVAETPRRLAVREGMAVSVSGGGSKTQRLSSGRSYCWATTRKSRGRPPWRGREEANSRRSDRSRGDERLNEA